MGCCKKSWIVAKSNLIQWKMDVRVRIVGLVEAVLLLRYLIGITIYGLTYGEKITPCLLPILFADTSVSNGLLKILLYLGLILLFCDAPFLDEKTPYLIVRSKRKAWWIGECMYIWIASFLYLAFLAIVSMIIVFPTLSISNLWGSILVDFVKGGRGLSQMAGVALLGNLIVPSDLIKLIYPSVAQLLSFFIGWVSFVLIGHLIYAINLITNQKIPGIAAAIFFVMLDPIVKWLAFGINTQWMYLFSPVSWSSIENWAIAGMDNPITIWYAFGVSGIIIIILTIIIACVSRKKQIDVISLQ